MRLLIIALALLYSSCLYAQSGSSPDLPGALRIQVGSNFLIDHPDQMDTGFWGSKTFNAHYLYAVRFGKSAFSFNPGFGIGTDKFSFDQNVTLMRDIDGSINIMPLDEAEFGDVKKTKLATTYFEVPLELRWHLNKDNFRKSVKVTVGGKFGLLLSSHTKIKYDHLNELQKLKTKDQFALSRFRYGINASIGVAGIAVYYYYGLNELFESGKGPEATQTTQTQVGISISVF